MKSDNYKLGSNFVVQDNKKCNKENQEVIDAKCEKVNLKEMITKLKYLNLNDQLFIYRLLKNHKKHAWWYLRRSYWTEYKIELLEGAQPYYPKPFPIPKVYEETLKIELNRLVSIGVLTHENNFE